jgi:hypothetical protein
MRRVDKLSFDRRYDEQLNGLHGITISDEVKAFYSFKCNVLIENSVSSPVYLSRKNLENSTFDQNRFDSLQNILSGYLTPKLQLGLQVSLPERHFYPAQWNPGVFRYETAFTIVP